MGGLLAIFEVDAMLIHGYSTGCNIVSGAILIQAPNPLSRDSDSCLQSDALDVEL